MTPSDRQIHLIANAHIDPVWLWDWREGLREILATFATACELIEEHPEYRFTASSAEFYRRVQQLDPPLLERIRTHVRSGRWAVVGGWWVEPDLNLPSGEALVRQGVYGKRFLHALLGCDVTIGFCPDSFGHPEGLPKILAALRQDCYVFMRPGETEKETPPVFRWRSADGSEVIAVRILESYETDGSRLPDKLRRLADLAARLDLPAVACYYGTGDHGGGPSRVTLQILDEQRRELGVQCVYSDPYQYREALRGAEGRLPVVADELQHHARGCYSVNRVIKLKNRRAEHALLVLERWAAVAWRELGISFPGEELEAQWRCLLFHQFHDVLAGTSIERACNDAEDALRSVLHFADERTEITLRRLAANIPVENPRGAFVVFNPWPWPVTAPLEFEYVFGEPEKASSFLGPDGRPLPIQHIRKSDLANSNRSRWVLVDTLPPLGFKRYQWGPVARQASGPRPLLISPTELENRWIRLELDPVTGEWRRLFHRTSHHDVLAGQGCTPVVLEDLSDTWSHEVVEYSGKLRHFGKAKIAVEESGPVRAVIRAVRRLGGSEIRFRTLLYADLPYLVLEVDVNWQQPRGILQLHFPIHATEPTVVAEQAYGWISRKPTGGEEPCQQWIDVCGEAGRGDGATGLLIVNDGLWSYSMKDNVLRLTLLRSPIYAHHDPAKPQVGESHRYIDIGWHRFRFLLYPHLGDWRSVDPFRLALAFNEPPRTVVMQRTRGGWEPEASFCQVEPENVVATVLKKAFDDEQLVLRCFETHGRRTLARVSFPHRRAEGQFEIGPYQLKTLAIAEREGRLEFREISALEWELVRPGG